jgi:hypothetical protein
VSNFLRFKNTQLLYIFWNQQKYVFGVNNTYYKIPFLLCKAMKLFWEPFGKWKKNLVKKKQIQLKIYIYIQGDSYSFINILTSGRFRSQKALDNKILTHTSKIGKNYHISFFTISKCHYTLIYSTLRRLYNKCHKCHNRSKQLLL